MVITVPRTSEISRTDYQVAVVLSMDPTALRSPHLGACREYHDHLQKIQRRNFEDRVFYHQPRVISWMQDRAPRSGPTNAERLVKEVYTNDPNPFPPQVGDNLLLFSVLLHEELQCGHMYRIFQSHLPETYHIQVEDLTKHLEGIQADLETSRPKLPFEGQPLNYSEVIRTFERLRWSFVPFRLHLNMSQIISHPSTILPFCYREVINDKGGTASVCLYGIQQDLVDDATFRKALEPSRELNKKYGIVSQYERLGVSSSAIIILIYLLW